MKLLFSLPKKKNIIVWDKHSERFSKKIFDEDDIVFLCSRREEIYLIIFLKMLLKGKIRKIDYYLEFIKAVNPKIVVTFIDANLMFYKLGKHLNIPTAFIQSGTRSSFDDIFEKLEKLNNNETKDFKVDMMFVFSDAVGKKYSNFISGNYIKVGSVTSNDIIKTPSKNQKLIYISNFRTTHLDKEKKIFKELTWPDILKTEELLLKFLHSYCIKNNLDFCVLGKYLDDRKNIEYDYYNKLIGKKNWSFIENNESRDTYKIIDQSKMVTGTVSTLMLESLARYNKTIFFGIRPDVYPINTEFFGHLSCQSEVGPFWVNKVDLKIFEETMDNVKNMEKEEWIKTLNFYKDELTTYDYGNKILKDKLLTYL